MTSDACTPQIEPDISIQTLEDKIILVIDVVPGKFRPYYLASKGKETSTYIRINGTSRPADARKLQELELEGQNISYDTLQEIGCEYDEKKALDLCKKMKQIAIDSCETEEDIKRFGAGCVEKVSGMRKEMAAESNRGVGCGSCCSITYILEAARPE